MDESARKNLIKSVRAKEFVQNDKKKTPLIAGIVSFVSCMIALILFSVVFSRFNDSRVLHSGQIVIFVLGVILFFVQSRPYFRKAPGLDLGKLSRHEEDLILNGEAVTAVLDSLGESGRQMHCICEYKGEIRIFDSPFLPVTPVVSENRKVVVFVSKDNVGDYFVNYFDFIPHRSNDHVLRDRSELKNASKKTYGRISTLIVLSIVFVIIGLPALGVGLITVIFADTQDGVFAGIFWLCAVPIYFAFVYGGYNRKFGKQESLQEKGDYLETRIENTWIERVKDKEGDEHEYYYVRTRYVEPNTNRVHYFTADAPSNIDKLREFSIRAYVDPNDTRKYYLDIGQAFNAMGFTAEDYGGDFNKWRKK